MLDEPLSALDDNLKFQIIPFLKNICETFTIPYIFISHSLTEMRIMTDKVLSVVGGRIKGQMTSEELARVSMGESKVGYTNLLTLRFPVDSTVCISTIGEISSCPCPEEKLLPVTSTIFHRDHSVLTELSARVIFSGAV